MGQWMLRGVLGPGLGELPHHSRAGLGLESLLLDENELSQAFFSLTAHPVLRFSAEMCGAAPQFARKLFGTPLHKTENTRPHQFGEI